MSPPLTQQAVDYIHVHLMGLISIYLFYIYAEAVPQLPSPIIVLFNESLGLKWSGIEMIFIFF